MRWFINDNYIKPLIILTITLPIIIGLIPAYVLEIITWIAIIIMAGFILGSMWDIVR